MLTTTPIYYTNSKNPVYNKNSIQTEYVKKLQHKIDYFIIVEWSYLLRWFQ